MLLVLSTLPLCLNLEHYLFRSQWDPHYWQDGMVLVQSSSMVYSSSSQRSHCCSSYLILAYSIDLSSPKEWSPSCDPSWWKLQFYWNWPRRGLSTCCFHIYFDSITLAPMFFHSLLGFDLWHQLLQRGLELCFGTLKSNDDSAMFAMDFEATYSRWLELLGIS